MMEPDQTRPPSEIRAVIFDMDGVLTDSEPLINAAAVAMFKEKGLVVLPEDFLPFVGTGEDRYIGGVAEKYQFPLDLPSAKARTYEIYLDLVPKQLHSFPGASELFSACRQAGLRVAVASSADRVKIEANLRQIGLPPERWDAIVVGEEVTHKKPAPDIFLLAASKLGLESAQCVVVEDAVNGVEAAKAAGMRCLAVAQTFSADRLQKADVVRTNLTEVSLADLLANQQPTLAAPVQPASERSSEEVSPIRPWGFWATIGLTLAISIAAWLAQAGIVVAFIIVRKISGDQASPTDMASSGLLLAIATCVSLPVVLGLAYLFAWIRARRDALQYLGFKPCQRRPFFRWTVAFLILIALSDALTAALGRPIVPPFMMEAYQSAGFTPLLWLAVVAAAPVAEETLFRGFLFEGLRHSRVGAQGAVIISAGMWASIHVQYDFYGIATIFVSGVVLGSVRFWTGSVILTIFLHSLMNLIATIEVAVKLRMQ